MNHEFALLAWEKACAPTRLRWYLFKETLLCAESYHCLPEKLACPQIAVFARDLPALAYLVFPELPEFWTIDKVNFGVRNRTLCFQQDKTPVLEVHVLYGAKEEAEIDEFYARIKRCFKKERKLRKWNRIGSFVPFYSKTAGVVVQRRIRQQTKSNYNRIIAITGKAEKRPVIYSDILTNKDPVQLPAAMFSDAVILKCGEYEYPAFSGYREYLEMVYGDYRGINDDIGCGLTVEEKEQLRAHQDRCFEALSFLQDISKEFDLQYYLLAGSVLGCVRHGGFIPWDDDIDIGIRIDKLKKFEEVVKEQLPLRLPEGFALVQSGPNNPYPRMFSKICFEGRGCIDLWPLVPTYEDGLKAKFLWYFGKLITKVHYGKIGYKVTKYRKIVNLLCKVMTDHMIMALARYNERKYAKRKMPAYINLYSIYRREKETIKREWLDDEATAKFRDLEVPVVGCTDAYLTHLYGDYMAFPAPWKRASRHSERFFSEE